MTTRKSSSMEAPAELSLIITRVFDAPRHLVFEAWTKQEHLDQWCAPDGFKISHSKGELIRGGGWECTMIDPSGEKLEVCGVYQEIVPDELLVFTHGWIEDGVRDHETTVTVRFEDEAGGKTRMIFEQSIFRSKESRDGHEVGWSEAFGKLAGHLAKLKVK
jgi:uncharacterized protein YndB with AHSA1/START domain